VNHHAEQKHYSSDSKVLGNPVGGLDAKFAEYFPILLNLASVLVVWKWVLLLTLDLGGMWKGKNALWGYGCRSTVLRGPIHLP